jgi:hypothetical protein
MRGGTMTDYGESHMQINVFSGGKFDILKPDWEDIFIEDIAHSLAYQCRFAGHTTKFYSVAEHSIILSHLTKPEDRLWALLHDSAEAYIGDVIRPVKHALPSLFETEHKILEQIACRFMLPGTRPSYNVEVADGILTIVELKDLLDGDPDPELDFLHTYDCDHILLADALSEKVVYKFYSPEIAEKKFLRRYKKLTQERNTHHESISHSQV